MTTPNIPQGRVVQLRGVIDDSTAQRVVAELLFYQMEDASTPVTLDIDSPGGSISASFAILDTMTFVKCPVWTRCRGAAQGTALMIFAAGASGRRRASRDAMFGFAKTVLGVSPRDAESTEAYLAKIKRRLVDVLAGASNQSPARIEADMAAGRCLTMEEALEYGLVDQDLSISSG